MTVHTPECIARSKAGRSLCLCEIAEVQARRRERVGLTLAEAAVRLSVSPDTLRQQVKNGRLAATKIGPLWMVALAEVDRYAKASSGRPGRPRKVVA